MLSECWNHLSTNIEVVPLSFLFFSFFSFLWCALCAQFYCSNSLFPQHAISLLFENCTTWVVQNCFLMNSSNYQETDQLINFLRSVIWGSNEATNKIWLLKIDFHLQFINPIFNPASVYWQKRQDFIKNTFKLPQKWFLSEETSCNHWTQQYRFIICSLGHKINI